MVIDRNLRLDEVPYAGSDFSLISEFANTFDGYQAAGSFEQCAAIAKSPNPASISDLRIFLFFWFRSLRHTDGPVSEGEEKRIRDVVEQIRELLRERKCSSVKELKSPKSKE